MSDPTPRDTTPAIHQSPVTVHEALAPFVADRPELANLTSAEVVAVMLNDLADAYSELALLRANVAFMCPK